MAERLCPHRMSFHQLVFDGDLFPLEHGHVGHGVDQCAAVLMMEPAVGGGAQLFDTANNLAFMWTQRIRTKQAPEITHMKVGCRKIPRCVR